MRLLDLSNPYLHRQLIAYIGNKRALLPFLSSVFDEIEESAQIATFMDPFAGSGAVARLAKLRGYQVFANDWEPYAQILNACHVGTDASEARELFAEWGGVEAVIETLNAGPFETEGFVSRNYAPASTEGADYRSERLFYTRENALFIDTVRDRIEELYPGDQESPEGRKTKGLLIATLLYEASTHANTSGVFKACHKGYGGHGRDALRRILAKMALEVPVLINGNALCEAFGTDATEFVGSRSADICYLDPPYNSHQYGSNYHLLNTVALWDAPPIDNSRNERGVLQSKAGIRSDWVATRSDYCYRRSAPSAFQKLIAAIDARFMVLSYNTEGIIPFEQLYDILEENGEVTVKSREYTKYPGGKQSLYRKVHNQELVLVVDREGRSAEGSRTRIRRYLLSRRVSELLRGSYHPGRLFGAFEHTAVDDGMPITLIHLNDSTSELVLRCELGYRFVERPEPSALQSLPSEVLETLAGRLEDCAVRDRMEEAFVLLDLIPKVRDPRRRSRYVDALVRTIRKFAFRKYRAEFEHAMAAAYDRVREDPETYRGVEKRLRDVRRIAELRFNG